MTIHDTEDPLAPARGCLIGLLIMIPAWIVLFWMVL